MIFQKNKNGEEVAPSGWQPGKLTLKPGHYLLGRLCEKWKTDMASD